MMNLRGAQLVGLLLIALALAFCAPGPASAEPPTLPGIIGDGARPTPACDTATDDDPGVPQSKTSPAAVSGGGIAVAPIDSPPAAAVPPLPLAVPRQVALEVFASRAPPLV
jgi:hypothetical protein